MSNENFEVELSKIIKENSEILSGFTEWLEGKGLASKTINKHIGNVDFYINECTSFTMIAAQQKRVSYSWEGFLIGSFHGRQCGQVSRLLKLM